MKSSPLTFIIHINDLPGKASETNIILTDNVSLHSLLTHYNSTYNWLNGLVFN